MLILSSDRSIGKAENLFVGLSEVSITSEFFAFGKSSVKI